MNIDEISFDEQTSFVQTREIKDWKPVLENLVADFGYSYYHAVLAWCGIIDNSSPDDFWEVWAIKFEGKVVGICGLYSQAPNFTDELWLGWLGIIPEYRNKKIGEKVLLFLKHICQEYKCRTLLSYVDKKGKPLNFYYRNGFTFKGTVAEYISDKPEIEANFSEYFMNREDSVISCPIEQKYPDQLRCVRVATDTDYEQKLFSFNKADLPEVGKIYTVKRFFYYRSPYRIRDSKWAVHFKELNHGTLIGYDARYFDEVKSEKPEVINSD